MAELKYIGKNILNHELQVKNGKIIGDHTEVIRVTVVSDGGNKYAFEGATTPDFTIDEGKTYRFDQSDSTNDNHPLRFSTTENGVYNGGSAYTTGVVTHGTPGVKGAYTEISVTKVTPNHLYYYCTQHSGMGNDAVLIKNDFSNLHRVSGSVTSTGSFGRIFAAGDIYATGEVSADSFVSRDGSETISFQDDVAFGADDSITSILNITASGEISASSFVGIFRGALSGSAQIASNISGAFSVASASFAADILSNSSSFATRITADSSSFSTRVTNLKTDSGSFSTRVTNLKADSGSFSTRITNLKTDSGSFSTRVTKNEGTGSKILNGQLEFTNITASANISSSGNITGNILNVKTRVKAIGSSLEFAGDTLDFVDGNSINRLFKGTAGGSVEAYHAGVKRLETTSGGINVIGNITGSGHISMSLSSTGSFGRVSATTLGGHSPLLIDSIVTASSAVQFDGKVFIQTGSIEGDLHVRTNDNFMRIGKSTSGLIVSGSESISRFATGSDGSIIDLGFTVINEDGGVVLAGDGDGIHVDSSNYWYNNKFYKIGDGSRNFLRYEPANGLRYKGELTVNTGSFEGNMFINSPTGSMFIGKYTGGIPTSGSDTISRFATGSDGSIIDLGFTTTNEEGETVFLTTGDGIVRDSENYWYTTGHFKVGNGEKQIEWNTTDLNVSASTVDVTTLKASDVNFAGLPTSDPLVTGSLWISGSSSSGSYKSGFVMISGIHG